MVTRGKKTKSSRRKKGQEKAACTVPQFGVPQWLVSYQEYSKSVDQADRIWVCYSRGTRRQYQGWKALFCYLLDTLICNTYLLSTYPGRTSGGPKRTPINTPHRVFQMRLAIQLLNRAVVQPQDQPQNQPQTRLQKHPNQNFPVFRAVASEHGQLVRMPGPMRRCEACQSAGRTVKSIKKGKALSECSGNSLTTVSGSDVKKRRNDCPKTHYGCRLCQIWLCQKAPCWQEHMILATQLRPSGLFRQSN
jgi:hypothetical protein